MIARLCAHFYSLRQVQSLSQQTPRGYPRRFRRGMLKAILSIAVAIVVSRSRGVFFDDAHVVRCDFDSAVVVVDSGCNFYDVCQ